MLPPVAAEPGPLPPEPVDEPRPGPGLDMVFPPGAPSPESLPRAAPPPLLLPIVLPEVLPEVLPDVLLCVLPVVLSPLPVPPGLIAPELVEPVPDPPAPDPVPWACRSTAVAEKVNATTVPARPFRIEFELHCCLVASIFNPLL